MRNVNQVTFQKYFEHCEQKSSDTRIEPRRIIRREYNKKNLKSRQKAVHEFLLEDQPKTAFNQENR
jgi:hypothetical protein